MRKLLAALLLASVFLGGCGDKDTNDESKKSEATASATQEATQAPAVPENLAQEALSSFSCGDNGEGQWLASGVLRNDEANAHRYRVTVFLGSGEGTAHAHEVGPIEANKTAEFSFGVLTPADAQATCRVQVERLDK